MTLDSDDWLDDRPRWQRHAACRGQGPAQWVGKTPQADYSAQRAICQSCLVRQECLDYALSLPDLVGCWGGTNEAERRELRRAVA